LIALVTGPPGSGKSYYAVRKAADALEAGKFVITNVPMVPDWHERVADRHPLRWLLPGRRRALKARWRGRVLHIGDDFSQLRRVRMDGKGEGRGVVVLDEAHVWMNSRLWRDDDRLEIVNWFSMHRKLGFDVYLITQDANNIDRQVRALFEYHVQLRNLKKMKVAGIPVSPINFFLAIWKWHAAKGAVVKREAYRLNWTKGLYDTMGMYGENAHTPDDVIRLPRPAALHAPAGNAPGRATSGAAAGAARRDPLDASTRRLLEIGHDVAESDRNSQPDQQGQE
jgi:adenosyl cobinamide kinase/adenosyl cobinamide phosphate guanylyltransferase